LDTQSGNALRWTGQGAPCHFVKQPISEITGVDVRFSHPRLQPCSSARREARRHAWEDVYEFVCVSPWGPSRGGKPLKMIYASKQYDDAVAIGLLKRNAATAQLIIPLVTVCVVRTWRTVSGRAQTCRQGVQHGHRSEVVVASLQ
jgi:hypothetical protein